MKTNMPISETEKFAAGIMALYSTAKTRSPKQAHFLSF